MKNSFNTLFIHTWALLAGIWAIPALAAEDAKRLNEQMPALPEFLPGKMPRVFELPPVTSGSEAAKPGEYRFNFSEVVFKGNTVFVSSELEVVAQPYLNREVTEADIETLRQKISQYYVDQGYINSGALILPIDPQSHRLEIKIVEGRIHRIQLGGMERLRDAYVTNRLQPDRQAPLNMDTLRERFQLLLDDPLIKSANAHLVPGSDLGESTLEVQVSRAKPYGARFAYNNYRPVSIGSEVANVSGWVRNLTGWGDYLALAFQASVEGAPGNHKDVNWKLPLNGRGTELALQYSYGASTVIEEVSRPLDIRSTLENWGLGISQTFYESLRHKLSAGLDWSYQHNRTSLLGFPFSFTPGVKNGETTDRGWRLWQEYQWRTEYQVMALRSTFSHMQNNLQKVTASVTTAQPETSYWVWLGQGQYSRQIFDNQAQFVSRLSVQFANDNLLSLDGMSIGGNNTVRGYRENELIRDRGAVLNLDLQIPVLRGWKDLALTAGPFYDIGHGRNMGAEAATISSSGAAVHANWKGVNLDLAIAKRLSHPAGMVFRDGDWQERGVHFQLSYDFPWI